MKIKRHIKTKKPPKKALVFHWWYLLLIFLFASFCLLSYTYYLFYWERAGNNPKTCYICLKEGTDLAQIERLLRRKVGLRHPRLFHRFAEFKEMHKATYEGRFEIKPSMSIADIVNSIIDDNEERVTLKIGYLRTKEELTALLSKRLLLIQDELLEPYSDDDFCKKYGFDSKTIALLFIPDTVELKWSCSPEELTDHFYAKYKKFWTLERRKKAKRLGYTPLQIGVIASIVEQESRIPADWPKIARVYMNRLDKKMRLQSDPTVKFALGEFDLRRIQGEHLLFDSPYNTYRYGGLPPGPICLPQKAVIDSVLNAPNKPYLYMCARADFSGKHDFTDSYAKHVQNARRYQQALDRKGIQ